MRFISGYNEFFNLILHLDTRRFSHLNEIKFRQGNFHKHKLLRIQFEIRTCTHGHIFCLCEGTCDVDTQTFWEVVPCSTQPKVPRVSLNRTLFILNELRLACSSFGISINSRVLQGNAAAWLWLRRRAAYYKCYISTGVCFLPAAAVGGQTLQTEETKTNEQRWAEDSSSQLHITGPLAASSPSLLPVLVFFTIYFPLFALAEKILQSHAERLPAQ